MNKAYEIIRVKFTDGTWDSWDGGTTLALVFRSIEEDESFKGKEVAQIIFGYKG